LLKSYRVTRVTGDRYAGEFPRELFRKCGIEYRCADKAKSDLYRDLLPLLNSGRIVLPKSDRLVNQIVGLERHVARSGKDSIDHSKGMRDDLCNAVAGVAAMVSKPEHIMLLGLGGRVISSTGMVVSDSITAFFDRMKPKPVPTTNDKLHRANLKQQHEEMRDRIEGPLQSPPELDAAAQARLEQFKADYLAKRATSIGNFHSKLFGNNGVQI
jgi:hypothetical protein